MSWLMRFAPNTTGEDSFDVSVMAGWTGIDTDDSPLFDHEKSAYVRRSLDAVLETKNDVTPVIRNSFTICFPEHGVVERAGVVEGTTAANVPSQIFLNVGEIVTTTYNDDDTVTLEIPGRPQYTVQRTQYARGMNGARSPQIASQILHIPHSEPAEPASRFNVVG